MRRLQSAAPSVEAKSSFLQRLVERPWKPVVTGDAGLSKRGPPQTQLFIIILPLPLPCTGGKSSISG